MHHLKGRVSVRKALLLLTSLMLVATALMPAIAAAATPTSTLKTSTIYMATAKPFAISGKTSTSLKGKRMAVEIRKPGRAFWTLVGTPLISKYGTWSHKYTPKLGGKFYIRARYSKSYTRTASLTVRKGPGVKYQTLLASTTSTRDSGLWEALRPAFLMACPEYSVKATFVGSGAAIALGGSGDADVLLVHSPVQEIAFMNGIVAGKPSTYKGLTRHSVMYNDFVLVGPKTDPANIGLNDTAKVAFGKVASSKSEFWSRNDNSGTNTKEKEIWASIGNPQTGQSWYKASGTLGMAQCLSAANQSSGYTLSDRGTWLNMVNMGTVKDLEIVNQGDDSYWNPYSVIQVAKARNWEGSQDFSSWIRSAPAQLIIKEYGESTFGQPLFYPYAGKW